MQASQSDESSQHDSSNLLACLVIVCVSLSLLLGGEANNEFTGLLWPGIAHADSALCKSLGDSAVSLSGTIANPDLMKAAIVWITFEDSSYCDRDSPINMPTWFRDVETDLEKYVKWQSYGKLILDVRTAQRLGDDSLKAWNLGHTACYWPMVESVPEVCPGAIAAVEGCVNRNTVDLIDGTYEGYFDDLDWVFFIHLIDDFEDPDTAGYDHIGYLCLDCPYSGLGTRQRPIMGQTDGDEGATKWLLSHEFGHTLGLQHTPASFAGINNPPPNSIYFGKYDNMQYGAPLNIDFVNNDYVPWHLWQLTVNEPFLGPNWFESAWFDTITVNTLDVRIIDVRNPATRNAVIVDTRINEYDSEFWLIHHQNLQFDRVYGDDRLAIWHMRNPTYVGQDEPQHFDLEIPTGKFNNCSPANGANATSGLDSLECRLHKGHPSDFFAHAGPDTFGIGTNPNTNDYAVDSGYPGEQTVATNIMIHDIRLDYPAPFAGGGESRGLIDDYKDYFVDVIYVNSGGETESPFLYTWEGKNFPRKVNLLAGHGRPAEGGSHEIGSDYIVLPDPKEFRPGSYLYKIREDGRSTTFIDQVSCLVVDHDPSVTIVASRQGTVFGYAEAITPSEVLGLSENGPDILDRGNVFEAAPGTMGILSWESLEMPIGSGGLVISSRGREHDNMSNEGGLIIERQDGRGGWVEISRISPRSMLTDTYLEDEEIGREGANLRLRVRWLDYHALDYVAYVHVASGSLWRVSSASIDSASIAYGGSRLQELQSLDGECAVLSPGAKLSVGFRSPDQGVWGRRSMIFGTHGYYLGPEGEVNAVGQKMEGKVIQYLDKNRPNPFNPSTRITFGLARGAEVGLGIYSSRGTLIREIYSGPLSSGDHAFTWDGRTANGQMVPSGMYFYKLTAGSETASGKMIAIK